MNYGETLAYWYLRLNGFFPITNFVIHKSEGIEYSADCDVLAIRPPLVYEEVGGQDDDWDPRLLEHINSGKTIGIICEVKTGAFEKEKLFRTEYVTYASKRLGITSSDDDIQRIAEGNAIEDVADNYRVIKLFISNKEEEGSFIYLSLESVVQFLLDRIGKYPIEKYRDRMFFGSILFQGLIEIKKMKEALNL